MARHLTAGEKRLAKDIFKDSIVYEAVRVHDDKYVFFQPDNSGMTPNGEIYVDGIYEDDYSQVSAQLKAFFIHEMVHVWQNQNGILTVGVIGSAIVEIIGQLGDYAAAYPYVLDESRDLTDYGLEQQASIVEDYFRLTRVGLQPRRARAPYTRNCAPGQRPIASRQLYEKVLRRFLADPSYGRQHYRRVCAP